MAAWLGKATICFGTVCGCARAAVVFAVFEWYSPMPLPRGRVEANCFLPLGSPGVYHSEL